jgi:hypothetical protein
MLGLGDAWISLDVKSPACAGALRSRQCLIEGAARHARGGLDRRASQLNPSPTQPRASVLARVLGAIVGALLLAAIGAAVLAGLTAFLVLFALMVPVLLVLLALTLPRGKVRVYVRRDGGLRPTERTDDRARLEHDRREP